LKISVRQECGHLHTFINASYHPPGSEGRTLLNYLSETINVIEDQFANASIFVGGDFNRLAMDDLEGDSGLTLLDSPPTRVNARLDLILTNRPDLIDQISTFKSNVETDHMGLLAKSFHKLPPVRQRISFRLFSRRGHCKLNTLLSSIDFSPLYKSNNIHDAANWLEGQVERCFQQAFPLKTVRMSDRDPSWLTPKVKWILTQKKQAMRRKQLLKAQNFNEYLKAMKLRYISRGGSRSWWQSIDSVTHRKVTNNRLDAAAFQPSQLNTELASRSTLQDGEIRELTPKFHLGCEDVPRLSMLEVARVMKNCKRTSPGPSGIPSFVFREYWDILTAPYLYIWNLSLENGIVPLIYKFADLIPIPKVRNAKCASEVRGISVTSIASRLFEKAVHKRWITPRVTSIGDPYQFAYKPRMSTIDCLLCLQHSILSMLDSSNTDGVHVALIDFSKAFDCVDQEKAAETYHDFINSPHIRKWLYDFTVNRKQRLIWQGTPQTYLEIDRGCSQGTVGGPGIFSMYTDSLRALNTSSRILKYSDDTTCLSPCVKQPSQHEREYFSKETKMLSDWATKKRLKLNLEKSKHIRFCLNRTPYCECLYIEDCFATVNSAKILGVTFQEDCSFRIHCRRLLSELRSSLYLFKDLKANGTSVADLHQVFQSLIISRIRYGISVYGSDSYSLLLIDKFLRKCHEKRYCEFPFDAQHLLREEDERNLTNILLNPRHPLHEYIVSHRKVRTTRHNFTSSKPYVRTKAFLRSFTNRILPF
jgi:hypothetical protein